MASRILPYSRTAVCVLSVAVMACTESELSLLDKLGDPCRSAQGTVAVCDEAQALQPMPCADICAEAGLSEVGCLEHEGEASCWCTSEGSPCESSSASACVDDATLVVCEAGTWALVASASRPVGFAPPLGRRRPRSSPRSAAKRLRLMAAASHSDGAQRARRSRLDR